MLKRLLDHLSPAGEGGRLSVLILHRVLPEPDPVCPDELDAAAFERLCGWLQQLFNVIGHGVTRVSDEIKAKKPTAHWTLARFIGLFLPAKRRRNLMQRLTGTDRHAERFRHFNRYMMLRLALET